MLMKTDSVTKKDLKEALDEATADIISVVLKGFDGVAKDFARLELRVEKIEDRLNKIENRLNIVEQKLDRLEAEVKDIKRTLNDLKADLPSPQEFTRLEVRVAKLEKAVLSS